ncbi:hypothetical protein ID866_8079 [Astraeus odoratus]|nr:hypothetical protein ID866_8079 [Astraeus odoratus]
MVSQINALAVSNVVAYAHFLVIFLHDYTLTFGEEIDRFWNRPRRNWAFVLFIANRYITILGRIPALMVNFLPATLGALLISRQLCDNLLLADEFSIGLLQIIGATVMTVRVYAMCGERRPVLYLFVAVLAIIIGVGCWALLQKASYGPGITPPEFQGCLRSISDAQAARQPDDLVGYAIAWGGQLGFDTLVFGITLCKLLHMESVGRRSLVDSLLRDGTMYFA